MNNCAFVGRLTKDPESRLVNEYKVVSFTIAVDRRDKNKNTDFIPCQAWSKTGELVEKYLKKGDKVGITGALEVRTYDKDGERRTAFSINVSSLDFIGSKKTEQDEPTKPLPVPPLLSEDQYINEEVSESDASLPFSIY